MPECLKCPSHATTQVVSRPKGIMLFFTSFYLTFVRVCSLFSNRTRISTITDQIDLQHMTMWMITQVQLPKYIVTYITPV